MTPTLIEQGLKRTLKVLQLMIQASKIQLAFYLSLLQEAKVSVRGEILIPKERKKIPVILDKEMQEVLSKATHEIEDLLHEIRPPKAAWHKFCPNCAYAEFCLNEKMCSSFFKKEK